MPSQGPAWYCRACPLPHYCSLDCRAADWAHAAGGPECGLPWAALLPPEAVLALRAARRPDPARAALTVFLLGAAYLMVFNPRTETNSYVILAAFTALGGALELVLHRSARRAAIYLGLAVVWGSENYGWSIFPLTNLWLKALCALLLLGWLARPILKGKEPQPYLPPAAP